MFKHVKSDILAGITVAVVALPLALAFGVSSGLGAAAGLYGAIFCGFFAALFGGTRTQVSGPTGPMMVIAAGVVGTYGQEYAILAGLFAGIIEILFGVMRLGSLIRLIPYPVISGFMNGIAGIIILSQKEEFLKAPLIAVVTMAVIIILPKLTRAVPSTLVALIIGSVFALTLGQSLTNTVFVQSVETIGNIPQGFPQLKLPQGLELSTIIRILPAAFALALLGTIDSLLTAVIVDGVTGTKHNSNRELIGQGIGNIVTGCFGGLAGTGATVRSVFNVRAGAKTRLAAMTHSVLLLLILVALGPIAKNIPLATLAGILIMTGVGMFDYKSFKDIRIQPVSDSLVMLTTFVLTVTVDLIVAVGAGLLLSSLFFIWRMSHLRIRTMSIDSLPLAVEVVTKLKGKVKVSVIEGPVFFGSADSVNNGLLADMKFNSLVIDLHHVNMVDATGATVLCEAIKKIKAQGKIVVVCGVTPATETTLQSLGVFEAIGEDRCFPAASEAVEYLASVA